MDGDVPPGDVLPGTSAVCVRGPEQPTSGAYVWCCVGCCKGSCPKPGCLRRDASSSSCSSSCWSEETAGGQCSDESVVQEMADHDNEGAPGTVQEPQDGADKSGSRK